MATVPDHRIVVRSRERLRVLRSGRLIVLAAISAFVVLNTVVDAFLVADMLTGRSERVLAWVAISLGVTAIINVVIIVLVWMLFETVGRVERESDRVQTFMDNMYRRLP